MSLRTYNYTMGFRVGSTRIPDPSVFTGKASALDSQGRRDAKGTLHRKMVATKHPIKLEYNNIDWAMMQSIMSLLTKESFKFTFPDPLEGLITIKAYVGDRDWSVVRTSSSYTVGSAVVPNSGGAVSNGQYIADGVLGEYIGTLKFSIIEY